MYRVKTGRPVGSLSCRVAAILTLILNALESVAARLNSFLLNLNPRDKDWVALSNLFDQKGHHVVEAEDKIVMFLANIAHETAVGTYVAKLPSGKAQYATVSPPLYINLYVLFYANLSGGKYREALSGISSTISFFQQTPTFTRDTLPDLDPQIEKLTFEFSNLDVTELNYVMGLLGAKYLPSVYYKVRLLPFKADAILGKVPAVQGLGNAG